MLAIINSLYGNDINIFCTALQNYHCIWVIICLCFFTCNMHYAMFFNIVMCVCWAIIQRKLFGIVRKDYSVWVKICSRGGSVRKKTRVNVCVCILSMQYVCMNLHTFCLCAILRERRECSICFVFCTYRKTALRQSVTVFTAAVLLANIHLYLWVIITAVIMDSQTTLTHTGTHIVNRPLYSFQLTHSV